MSTLIIQFNTTKTKHILLCVGLVVAVLVAPSIKSVNPFVVPVFSTLSADDDFSCENSGIFGCYNAFTFTSNNCGTSCMNCGQNNNGSGYDLSCSIKCDGASEDAYINCGGAGGGGSTPIEASIENGNTPCFIKDNKI